MTPAKIWTIARWPLAILALAALANYAYPRFLDTIPTLIEFDASGSILAPETDPTGTETDLVLEPTVQPTLAPPSGPVTEGSAPATADLFVNDITADIDSNVLVISDDPDDAVVAAFDLPPGDPGCMASMTLTLTVTDVRSTTEVGVFASNLTTVGELVDFQVVEGDLRASASPMATALVEAPGQLQLDVLAGYQTYFTIGQPPGSPFVVTIVPTVPVESQGGVTFASSDTGGEEGPAPDAPTLSWTGQPDCPA